MAFSASEREIDALSPQILKTTSDAALFLELAMRGYDLYLLRSTHGLLSEVGEAQRQTVLPPDNQNGH